MSLILVFIFGLILGSFLNAVIFRLYSKESIWLKRSHCVTCNHQLNHWDLIPVFSFIFLWGKCRYCSAKISWQYPVVELVTGLSFVLLAQNFGLNGANVTLLLNLILICFLIVIGVYDLKHYLILDKVIFPAMLVAILRNAFSGQDLLLEGILAGFLVSGFFAFQFFVSGGKWIGFGDVKFGLFLGNFLGIKLSIVMLMLAYFSGAFIGVTLVVFGWKQLGSKLPFGLFLSFASICSLIYGSAIAAWYLQLVGIGN